MKYKYKFTCEYTKTAQSFKETIEYDHEPSEDELEADYNDWLSNYVVGDWHEFDDLCHEGIYFWLRRADNDY